MRNRLDLIAVRAMAGAATPARLLGPSLALALGAGCLLAPPSHAGTMTVALNHSARLSLSGPAASVVVGNPAVADVTVVDSRTVFVSGRGAGSTDVSVLDPLGRVLFSGDVHVSSQAGAHVTIHRGANTVSDVACDPTCVAVSTSATGFVKPPAGGTPAAAPGALAGGNGTISEAASNSAGAVPAGATTSLGHT